MSEADNEKLIRQYAAGEITWRALRERGLTITCRFSGHSVDSVFGPLVAPIRGPNVEARERGRAIIREALRARK
jgi:hypothetical protein